MASNIKIIARGHGSPGDAEAVTISTWRAELFAPDRELIDTFSWQDKRDLGFNLQTYRNGELVGFAHVFARCGLADETPVLMGCLGSVMTSPAHQGEGVGAETVQAANRILIQNLRADLGVLLCKSELTPFYAKHGWRRLPGPVTIDQPQGKSLWSQATMALLPATERGLPGRLDLCGPPF